MYMGMNLNAVPKFWPVKFISIAPESTREHCCKRVMTRCSVGNSWFPRTDVNMYYPLLISLILATFYSSASSKRHLHLFYQSTGDNYLQNSKSVPISHEKPSFTFHSVQNKMEFFSNWLRLRKVKGALLLGSFSILNSFFRKLYA